MKTITSDNKNNISFELESLQNKVISLQEENQNLLCENQELRQSKKSLDAKYQYLLEQLKLARRHRFGSSSEKMPPTQKSIFDEPGIEPEVEEEDEAETVKAETTATVKSHSRRRGTRKPLPADIPREDITLDVPETQRTCSCCQKTRPRIGEDVTEKLELIPLQVKAIRYIRPRYGACCETEGVVVAAQPRLFLPKCVAGPSVASFVIISKYEDHLPLYRQENIWKRYGIDYPRASMCRTVLKSAEYCEPLLKLMKQDLLTHPYLQVDETPVQVLNEPNKKNTSKSYMWCYRGGPPDKRMLIFEYQPSRAGQHVKEFLNGFKGHVQSDGYSGYEWLEFDPDKTQGGCMMHVRRKFVEAAKLHPKEGLAHQAIDFIRELYEVEDKVRPLKGQPLDIHRRYETRQQEAKPILDTFKDWLGEHASKVPPKIKLGEAFTYAINQWDKVITYLDHGQYEMDNGLLENALRPFALGRGNWLFAGSPTGAKAGALFYSLIGTAKMNGLIPFDYLQTIFERIRDCWTEEDYRKLLPYSFSP